MRQEVELLKQEVRGRAKLEAELVDLHDQAARHEESKRQSESAAREANLLRETSEAEIKLKQLAITAAVAETEHAFQTLSSERLMHKEAEAKAWADIKQAEEAARQASSDAELTKRELMVERAQRATLESEVQRGRQATTAALAEVMALKQRAEAPFISIDVWHEGDVPPDPKPWQLRIMIERRD